MADRTLPSPPPELAKQVERNREAFKAQFGAFEEAVIDRYWLGTSEDGAWLAFQFHRPDGTVQRFTLRAEWVLHFITELAGASDEMNERRLLAGLASAAPVGQA
ncbi:hypothetical protein [Mesorhizobium sp. 128a]